MNETAISYSIGAVSKMTGVEKHKLRHWSDRYFDPTLRGSRSAATLKDDLGKRT